MERFTEQQWTQLNKILIPLFKNKNLRTGQSYMIALFKVDEKLYNEVTGTSIDPFYDDDKVIDLIRFLMVEKD